MTQLTCSKCGAPMENVCDANGDWDGTAKCPYCGSINVFPNQSKSNPLSVILNVHIGRRTVLRTIIAVTIVLLLGVSASVLTRRVILNQPVEQSKHEAQGEVEQLITQQPPVDLTPHLASTPTPTLPVTSTGSPIPEERRVRTPFSAEQLQGRQYKEVEDILKEAGFINVESIGEKNLRDSIFRNRANDVGRVTRVTIDGEDDFQRYIYYSNYAKVKVWFNSYP